MKQVILTLVNLVLAAILIGILIYPRIQAGKVVQTKVVYEPNLYAAPLFVAMEEGYFDSLHVQVTAEKADRPGDEIDEVVKGKASVGFGAPWNTFFFKVSARPSAYRVIASAQATVTTPQTALVTLKRPPRPRRPIRRISQLLGRRVGFLTGSKDHFLLRYVLKKEGIDPELVSFVALSLTDMTTALDDGVVDALLVIEPLRSLYLNRKDIRVLEDGFVEKNFFTPYPIGVTYTSVVSLDLKRNETRRVIRAVERALEFIRAFPESTKAILRKHLELPDTLDFNLPDFAGYRDLDLTTLDRLFQSLRETEVLLRDFDYKDLLLQPHEVR